MKLALLSAGVENRGNLAFENLLELTDLNFEDPSSHDSCWPGPGMEADLLRSLQNSSSLLDWAMVTPECLRNL